jgi:hypothetical protein
MAAATVTALSLPAQAPLKMPPLMLALLDHSKVCKPCNTYFNRSPFETNASPCDNGRRALVALTINPAPMTLGAVLIGIQRLAASRFPMCPKCERIIRTGELTDSHGREHIDCALPAIEPFSEFLRRLR